jgi:predicted nuclease with TOPRIM domain
MLRNREASRTTQLLEAVSRQLEDVHAGQQELRTQNMRLESKLDDSRTENRDLKRRIDYLEGELAKRACWDPALQEERTRYTYFLVEGSVALKRKQGGIRAELYKHAQTCRALCPLHHLICPMCT